jgi:antirestriction protein ArdC
LGAEISAAFVCAALGVVPTVRHADYVGAWIDHLGEDNRAIVRAACFSTLPRRTFATETSSWAGDDDRRPVDGGLPFLSG